VEPSLLLHPLDFLGSEEGRALGFFPAMSMSLDRKRALISGTLALLVKSRRIVQLAEHADTLSRGPSLPLRPPPELGNRLQRQEQRAGDQR